MRQRLFRNSLKVRFFLSQCDGNYFKKTGDRQEKINYVKMILSHDDERLKLIDSQRDKNLAHALIIFTASYGAALKFLPDANPFLISTSLFFIALCFFLRDFQLHKYEHGWSGTIKKHYETLSSLINDPSSNVKIDTYYKIEEKK